MSISQPTQGARPGPKALPWIAFFALLPLVAAGGAMGLPLALGLVGLVVIQPRGLKQAVENNLLNSALLVAFLVWTCLSSLWSPWDGQANIKVPVLIALGLSFAYAASSDERITRLNLAGALSALIVLVGLLLIEAAFGLPLNTAAQPTAQPWELNGRPARGVVVMLSLTWPALAWLIGWRTVWRWAAAIAVAAFVAAASLQFGQLSTAIGFAVGLSFFSAAFAAPRLAMLAPFMGLAVWMLAAPFATPALFASQTLFEVVPHSWAVRMGIWRYTCDRILEQPWFGHGIDAGRATTERVTYDGEALRAIPIHPHSASLQIWFELGLVGALLAAALIALLGVQVSRMFAHDKPAAAAAAAVIAMFGMMANVGWSLWQEWWLATMLLAATLVAAVGARRS